MVSTKAEANEIQFIAKHFVVGNRAGYLARIVKKKKAGGKK